jgi:hypothetical protein
VIARLFSDVTQLNNSDVVVERVVVLDGLWGTRLYMESGSADRIAESISKNARSIIRLTNELAEGALEKSPGNVCKVATEIMRHVLNHTPDCRENYSFATKFFHWSTRHHFPIVDSKARVAINAIQKDKKVRPRIRKSIVGIPKGKYIEEYAQWIHFYSDLIRSISAENRQRLIKVDAESQASDSSTGNTLLRVLDKVFYYKGGGRGLGRID